MDEVLEGASVRSMLLQAEPEPLEIDPRRTAVIVIDMQNAFLSEGGMFDLRGKDLSRVRNTIEPIKNVCWSARANGMRVIYVVHRHSSDLRETGGSNSPYRYKGDMKTYHAHPEWRDKLILAGTWGAEIVPELERNEDDIVVVKPRYSAFFGTNLDIILRTYDIKYLIFVGVTTNICVETSIRDAFNLDYFSILISDGSASGDSGHIQEAAISNIRNCFGWVTTSEHFVKAMG